MEAASSPLPCPNTVTVRRNPHRRARPGPTPSTTNPPQNPAPSRTSSDVPPFPIQDILSIEIPPNSKPNPDPDPKPASENLKVYLRIRPPLLKAPSKCAPDYKQRQRNVWPQNPIYKKSGAKEKCAKKKSSGSEVCVSINDSQSVTLSPPSALQESKRIKSELYKGFSHVFSSESSQNEVYEKMVRPLVEDFLNGKDRMLAALGPSGSGKTHTVFGTVREPGMVPLALRQIFEPNPESGYGLSRSFYLSVFEIYSERGKVERILDLSLDGAELSMQQSTVKGLKEEFISDVAEAESLIACALLKRATAMTNTNSQSSRSQCIINIRSVVERCNREWDIQPKDAVLTIVDLAGAEREKRTGNQGSRLLESNFINNTSMVFGLCLRSLLESQKNSKKPLQKHFQNSLLTRYLRDYLEGKKQMTLILTVKPGEEDYLDTAYLLRQASPYMKIKFLNVDEPSITVHNKRHIQTMSKAAQPKRMKYSGGHDADVMGEKGITDENPLLDEDVARICKSDPADTATIQSDCIDLTTRERNYLLMQNFAKALWNVLKDYKEKLTVAEKEIQSLTENLRNEKTRNVELERKLEDFKSCCTCFDENPVQHTLATVDILLDPSVDLKRNEHSNFNEKPSITESLCDNSPEMSNSKQKEEKVEFSPQLSASIQYPELTEFDGCSTPEKGDSSPRCDEASVLQTDETIHSSNLKASEGNSTAGQVLDVSPQEQANPTVNHKENVLENECNINARHSEDVFPHVYREQVNPALNRGEYVPQNECHITTRQGRDVSSEEQVNQAVNHEEDVPENECHITARQSRDNSSELYREQVNPAVNHEEDVPENERQTTSRQSWDVSPEEQVNPAVYHEEDVPENECHITARQSGDVSSEEKVNPAVNHGEDVPENECHITARQSRDVSSEEQVNPAVYHEEDVPENECNSSYSTARQSQDISFQSQVNPAVYHEEDVPKSKPGSDFSSKQMSLAKPKRRLLPASSVLLRDFTALGIEDEPEKPQLLQGRKGGKKLAVDERERTQGSISLLRLLQNNLRL